MDYYAVDLAHAVLIAHGAAELCDCYRHFLTKHGYEVETSSDGLDCLKKLRRATPAVLVLDLELRWGGDGIPSWLREENPAHGIPVILTARAGHSSAFLSFIEPPVVDSLPKPFALNALLEKVRSAIAEKIPQEQSNGNRVWPEPSTG